MVLVLLAVAALEVDAAQEFFVMTRQIIPSAYE